MNQKCVFCGADLVEGKCPNDHQMKRMCLNCSSCSFSDESGYVCTNATVLEIGKEKTVAPEGYEIEVLELKHLKLKNPCKKCPQYELNRQLIEDIVFAQ